MIKSVNDILYAIDEQQYRIGMSDYEAARKAGISRASLSRWKCGERLPQLSQLLRVMDVVGLELSVVRKENGKDDEQIEILRA